MSTDTRDMPAALIRYLGSDAARSQRWIAPVVLYVGLCAIFNTDAGPLLTTYADTCACLLVASIWLTWVVGNSEDPVQASITATTIGSVDRLRLAKLTTTYLACAACGIFATALPLVLQNHTDRATLARVAAGAVAHLVVAAAGVAVGSLLVRPVIQRAGWVFVVAATATLVEIIVPGFPPLRQILVAFNADHPVHLARTLTLTTLETAAGGALLTACTVRIARLRS